MKEVDIGRVLLGDDHECQVKDVGLVKLSLLDVIVRVVKYVRFVPKLKRNLILLGSLDAIGYSIKISKCNYESNEDIFC